MLDYKDDDDVEIDPRLRRREGASFTSRRAS